MATGMDGSKLQNLLKETAAIKEDTMARGMDGGKCQNLLKETAAIKKDTTTMAMGMDGG